MEWMENIRGLQHIGIPTEDMDKTVEFYQKLGFTVALDTENQGDRVAFLKLKDLILEAYEVPQAAMEAGAINHIALDVADIEKAYEYVSGLGVKRLAEITFLPF